MSMLVCITTFRKNLALEVLLQSLLDNGYKDIHVADDNSNKPDKTGKTALEICEKFRGRLNITFAYNEKSSMLGVAKNKNRNLRFFFENKQFDRVLLLDDDICILRSDIEDHLNSIKDEFGLEHISGYWTDEDAHLTQKLTGLTGNPWEMDFPVIMQNKSVNWHSGGVQGCFVTCTRELAEKAMYFKNDWHSGYGAEHSQWSARLNMLTGWSPTLFPSLRYSSRYLRGQNIPNDYAISHEKIELNMTQYHESLKSIERGLDLKEENHGLPKKGEKSVCL